MKIAFDIINKIAMHTQKGVPILHHDQLNIVAKCIVEINDNIKNQGQAHQKSLKIIIPSSTKKMAKLTHLILKV